MYLAYITTLPSSSSFPPALHSPSETINRHLCSDLQTIEMRANFTAMVEAGAVKQFL